LSVSQRPKGLTSVSGIQRAPSVPAKAFRKKGVSMQLGALNVTFYFLNKLITLRIEFPTLNQLICSAAPHGYCFFGRTRDQTASAGRSTLRPRPHLNAEPRDSENANIILEALINKVKAVLFCAKLSPEIKSRLHIINGCDGAGEEKRLSESCGLLCLRVKASSEYSLFGLELGRTFPISKGEFYPEMGMITKAMLEIDAAATLKLKSWGWYQCSRWTVA
jgi:hypothetical protein